MIDMIFQKFSTEEEALGKFVLSYDRRNRSGNGNGRQRSSNTGFYARQESLCKEDVVVLLVLLPLDDRANTVQQLLKVGN